MLCKLKQNHVSDFDHVDGLVQDCCNSIANALELLQSTIPVILVVENIRNSYSYFTIRDGYNKYFKRLEITDSFFFD